MLQNFSVDDKTFLLEAIQRLCSSLKPEIAISGLYEHIARFLPLTSFSLLSASPEDSPGAHDRARRVQGILLDSLPAYDYLTA